MGPSQNSDSFQEFETIPDRKIQTKRSKLPKNIFNTPNQSKNSKSFMTNEENEMNFRCTQRTLDAGD